MGQEAADSVDIIAEEDMRKALAGYNSLGYGLLYSPRPG